MSGEPRFMRKIIATGVIRVMALCRLWVKGILFPVPEVVFVPEGWDWNRLPGTTTIHLPFELLDSPLKGTTMARSKENFSGSTSLDGKNGMFAMKLMERDYENFTPDFVARKSVFCFDNRMVCLGTGITNSNTEYPTETTLFQTKYNGKDSKVGDDGLLAHGMVMIIITCSRRSSPFASGGTGIAP